MNDKINVMNDHPPPTPDTTAAELLGLVGEWERRARGFRTTEFGRGKKEGIEECAEDLRTLAGQLHLTEPQP